MRPTFSIITITYNSARYLEETIRSVLAQDATDLEYLIIDGGSTDETLPLIKRYAASDSRIRWISEADNGISDAMNKGIALATGDVIAHLHSDDFYQLGTLTAVANAFENDKNICWVVGGYNVVDAEGSVLYAPVQPEQLTFEKLLKKNLVPHPATFVRREWFAKLGMFDLNLKYAMDYDFFLRLSREAAPKLLPDVLTSFRRHTGSLSTLCEIKAFREEQLIRMRYVASTSFFVRTFLWFRYVTKLTIMMTPIHNSRKRFLSKLSSVVSISSVF